MLLHADITDAVIGAAIKVHSELGPGLLESAYSACLRYEFEQASLRYDPQVPLPLHYRGVRLDTGYRIDFLVEEVVIVEIKAVEAVLPLHRAQLLSYLRLSRRRVGLLLNFNVSKMAQGIHRMVLSSQQRTSGE
ncbi:MAG: GxxExxY protein [Acidobacteria bacterium]|nr:GxxExxY protein [Acidobacteriota bacterium]